MPLSRLRVLLQEQLELKGVDLGVRRIIRRVGGGVVGVGGGGGGPAAPAEQGWGQGSMGVAGGAGEPQLVRGAADDLDPPAGVPP